MQTDTLKYLVTDSLESLKAHDITYLDVSALTQVTDLMIVATGTSTRHVAALAQHLVENAKATGMQPRGVEGGHNADWVLVDLDDVIVHIMLAETRELYDLERLWADLPADTTLSSNDIRGRLDDQAAMR